MAKPFRVIVAHQYRESAPPVATFEIVPDGLTESVEIRIGSHFDALEFFVDKVVPEDTKIQSQLLIHPLEPHVPSMFLCEVTEIGRRPGGPGYANDKASPGLLSHECEKSYLIRKAKVRYSLEQVELVSSVGGVRSRSSRDLTPRVSELHPVRIPYRPSLPNAAARQRTLH